MVLTMALPDVYSKAIGFFSFYISTFLPFYFLYMQPHGAQVPAPHSEACRRVYLLAGVYAGGYKLFLGCFNGSGSCVSGFDGEDVQRMSPYIEASDGLHFGSCV